MSGNVATNGRLLTDSAIAAFRQRLQGPVLTPQDAGRPRLHITIQNKVTAERARATFAELERDFTPRPLRIAGLAIWYYRGGPWELIRRYAFRG